MNYSPDVYYFTKQQRVLSIHLVSFRFYFSVFVCRQTMFHSAFSLVERSFRFWFLFSIPISTEQFWRAFVPIDVFLALFHFIRLLFAVFNKAHCCCSHICWIGYFSFHSIRADGLFELNTIGSMAATAVLFFLIQLKVQKCYVMHVNSIQNRLCRRKTSGKQNRRRKKIGERVREMIEICGEYL